jgi:UDP-glucose 4-epimerase
VRVVITGGGGKSGMCTVAELSSHGHEVTVVDIAPAPATLRPDVVWWECSVEDPAGVEAALRAARADAVVHLARSAPTADDRTTYRSHVMGTYHVLAAAVASGVGIAVVGSSIRALGDYWRMQVRPRYLPLDEAHPCAPCGAYEAAKRSIEETCGAVAREHGLTTVAIRPTGIVAPDQWPDLRRRREAARAAGKAFIATPLDNYVDARDVAQLIRLAVEAAVRGAVTGAAVFHAAAADSPTGRPLSETIGTWRPEWADLAAGLGPEETGISIAAAQQTLGYAPRYPSRDLLAAAPAQGV